MGTSLFFKWFGIGGLSDELRSELEQEGLVLLAEAMGGSLRMRRFRWSHGYSGRGIKGAAVTLVVTKRRFAAYLRWSPMLNPLLDVQLDDPRLRQLRCKLKGRDQLSITYDGSVFHSDQSGEMEVRIKTERASDFLKHIQEAARSGE